MKETQEEQFTATRSTLADAWKSNNLLLDWMHAPGAANSVNKMVSGKDLPLGHWAQYAKERHIIPLLQRLRASGSLQDGLSMVSLGCGSGHIEKSLITDFGWPVNMLQGLEYDSALRADAQRRFSGLNDLPSAFDFFDFNSSMHCDRKYDVVFCCHSIHHATNLEFFLPVLNGLMRDDSIFIGIDFFGPTRFQIEPEVKNIIRKLDHMLPSNLRLDLRESPPRESMVSFPSIAEVIAADITESPRSSDLRNLLFSNFPIIDIKSMGGTILRWLLQYRAGNFDHHSPEHRCIANLLFYIEELLIEQKMVRSDDLFFVLGRSDSL
jgi:SAM-dependent methyltransferase